MVQSLGRGRLRLPFSIGRIAPMSCGDNHGAARVAAFNADPGMLKMNRLFVFVLFVASLAHAQSLAPNPLDKKFDFRARLALYARRTYTDPWRHVRLLGEVAVGDFAFGGINKWGTGLSGYGRSLAPVYGQRVISNTVEFVAGAVIGDDARYRPSSSRGLVKRSLHAAVSTFTARARSGHTRPAYSRIIAVTAALLIANQWQPSPKTGFTLADALVFNVTDMAQDNLQAEFTPDLKRFGRRCWHIIRPAKGATHP